MLKKWMPPELVLLEAEELSSPEEVLRSAAQLMVDAGKAAPEYIDELLCAYKKMGPYFVIAPGIALPHIRPTGSVYENGIAFIRLKEPVAFGHPSNDPVKLVFLLAGAQSDSHLDMIGVLGEVMNDDASLQLLFSAESYDSLVLPKEE